MELLDNEDDHVSSVKFQCPTCKYYFMNEYEFEKHSKKHLKGKGSKYKCMICKFISPSFQTVKRHVYRKHPTILIKYKCNECGKDFLSSKLLRHHKKSHHSSCDICGKSFMKRKHLTTHKKLRHSEIFDKPFKCLSCPREFVFAHLLKKHEDQYQGKCYSESLHPESHQYVCSICDKVFTELHTLQKHEQMHKDKPYECLLCHSPFVSLYCLRNHINRAHLNVNKESILFTCRFCGNGYTRAYSLNEHIANFHKAQKVHICAKCGEYFSNKHEFEKHRRMHYGCMYCGKMNRGELSLSKHENQCRLEHIKTNDLDEDFILGSSQVSVKKVFTCPLCAVKLLDDELADHLCDHAAKNHNKSDKGQLEKNNKTLNTLKTENSDDFELMKSNIMNTCDEEPDDYEPDSSGEESDDFESDNSDEEPVDFKPDCSNKKPVNSDFQLDRSEDLAGFEPDCSDEEPVNYDFEPDRPDEEPAGFEPDHLDEEPVGFEPDCSDEEPVGLEPDCSDEEPVDYGFEPDSSDRELLNLEFKLHQEDELEFENKPKKPCIIKL